MSSPIRKEDGWDNPLLYAPRWARKSPSVSPELSPFAAAPPTAPTTAGSTDREPHSPASDWSEPTVGNRAASRTRAAGAPAAAKVVPAPPMAPIADSPPMAPGVGGFNIELPLPQLRPFEGDVAVQALRHRLALEPDVVPEPPQPQPRASALPWIRRLSLLVVVAAVATYCITLLLMPHESRQPLSPSASLAPPETASLPAVAPEPARLIVENQRAFANEPLPLGVSLNESSGSETVTLVGLATGTRLTAGMPLGPTGWQVSARDVEKVYAYAPKDFVGVMDAAIDLRSARDRLVDSRMVRLEWMPRKEARLTPRPEPAKPAPIVQTLDPAEIAMLVKRGEEFLKAGDISTARLFLRRAASAGDAQAALALGATYDPAVMAEQGVLGIAPDPAQARNWYEKAAELGSSEASRRLERLASRGM